MNPIDVAWGEDYDSLSEVASAVFARQSPLVDRTTAAVAYPEQIAQFGRLDWLTLGDPAGQSAETAAVGSIAAVYVEMGRALAETPLLDLTTARDAALLVGSDTANRVAASIGDGSVAVLPAFNSGGWGPRPVVENGALKGTARPVGYADRADYFLIAATGTDGDDLLVLVDRTAAGVTAEKLPNIGEYSMFALTFADVPVGGDAILARGAAAGTAVRIALERAAVLRAAQVYGAGSRLLDITVQYAKTRHQFGGPIGRFQAVQYLCTDIAVEVHLTSAYARRAAQALDGNRDARLYVALLSKQAAKTAQLMVHCAHEVHAGIGYMTESDVHLFTKAGKRWHYDFGTDEINDRTITDVLDHGVLEAQS